MRPRHRRSQEYAIWRAVPTMPNRLSGPDGECRHGNVWHVWLLSWSPTTRDAADRRLHVVVVSELGGPNITPGCPIKRPRLLVCGVARRLRDRIRVCLLVSESHKQAIRCGIASCVDARSATQ